MADDWRALNRLMWDERVPIHLGVGGYELDSLRASQGRLNAIEEAELGAVAGLRVLHLQCHFGRESLILASRGADVTGVDFSAAAIEAARGLAAELGLATRFIQCDLYAAPEALPEPGSFDLVFVTWGTICWLPDIAGWARIIAHFLRPGGALYFADAHPVAYVHDDEVAIAGRPGWLLPYFDGEPFVHHQTVDYVDASARLIHSKKVTWLHTLADIIGALHGAGLRLEWLHEHPRVTWRMFKCLIQDADGCWTWPDRPWLPLSFSLRAVRAG